MISVVSAVVIALLAPPPAALPGRAMVDAYFDRQLKAIESKCLTDLTTRADWDKLKPEMRRQFFEMMGLWPLPERSPLNATVHGTVDGPGFTVERLSFESRPGLIVTANVYVPKGDLGKRKPTILYVCGHGNVVENGISYGSKTKYQYHPAWFAQHGYVCLILDTLQLGELPGEHHGTYRLKQWWWQGHGYTPAGVELWNAIRALDYLETRPDVDAKKIGVTGRSGGGATSWWVLAADDRPACGAPVAGIADLRAHLLEGQTDDRLKHGVIVGHCDCMFLVNSYRWDFAQVAALAAPRPLLLGNSDQDGIFPVNGYRRLAKKVASVYEMHGRPDLFQLLETKGPHQDTPELRIGINRFMNRYLKGDTTTNVVDDLPQPIPVKSLKVVEKLPTGAINAKMPEAIFRPKPFDGQAVFKASPRDMVFDGAMTAIHAARRTLDGNPLVAAEVNDPKDGVPIFRRKELTIETESGIRVSVFNRQTIDAPMTLRLTLGDEPKWTDSADPSRLDLWLQVRGVGKQRWAEPGSVEENHLRRRFPLIGETMETGQVRDVLAVVEWLRKSLATGDHRGLERRIEMTGERSFAGLALLAALADAESHTTMPSSFSSSISRLTLIDPPSSFRDATAPQMLGLANHADVPQLVATAAMFRPVVVTKTDPAKWSAATTWAKETKGISLSVTK